MEEEDDIMVAFVKFYEDLFTYFGNDVWKEMLCHVPCLVIAEDNAGLLKEVTDEEIEEAVFMLGALKAPGPDGFNGYISQKFWEIIKKDIFSTLRSFFSW